MKFRLGAQFGNIINHPQYIPGSNPGFGLGVNDVNGFSSVALPDTIRSSIPATQTSTIRRLYLPATLGPWPSLPSSPSNFAVSINHTQGSLTGSPDFFARQQCSACLPQYDLSLPTGPLVFLNPTLSQLASDIGTAIMKILVIGAGAVGGYFGGRLAQANRDVTFLVHRKRAEAIKANGLQIVSPHGDVKLHPKTIVADEIKQPYDLILLGVKNYALSAAVNDFAAAVGPDTMILPFLNGMSHIDLLIERFGKRAVLGGVCLVATEIDRKVASCSLLVSKS